MRLIIENTPQQVAQWAANYIIAQIKNKEQHTSSPFVLGLPTGSTPLETYKELIAPPQGGRRCRSRTSSRSTWTSTSGLPEEHPESYHSFMWNNFFKHVDIRPDERQHPRRQRRRPGTRSAPTTRRASSRPGGIDLFMGGVGEDGHIAFNEPFSSLNSRTRLKTLTQDTIQVNARFFGGDISLVPKTALTVGVGTVLSAKKVLILATGHKKARAVRHGVEGSYNHQWTILGPPGAPQRHSGLRRPGRRGVARSHLPLFQGHRARKPDLEISAFPIRSFPQGLPCGRLSLPRPGYRTPGVILRPDYLPNAGKILSL